MCEDIRQIVETAAKGGATVKVILETCLLTDEQIVDACRLSKEAGAAFVKTSTGFSTAGATTHHVRLMRETVGDAMQVKASGGIRDKRQRFCDDRCRCRPDRRICVSGNL